MFRGLSARATSLSGCYLVLYYRYSVFAAAHALKWWSYSPISAQPYVRTRDRENATQFWRDFQTELKSTTKQFFSAFIETRKVLSCISHVGQSVVGSCCRQFCDSNFLFDWNFGIHCTIMIKMVKMPLLGIIGGGHHHHQENGSSTAISHGSSSVGSEKPPAFGVRHKDRYEAFLVSITLHAE